MNIKDLWIGDNVVIKRSNREGRFEGIHKSGKARVLCEGKMLLIPAEGLMLAPEKKPKRYIDDNEPIDRSRFSYAKRQAFTPKIDLHIDKLQPEKQHENPIAILEFQIRKLQEFMKNAIELRLPKVEIIHGRGTGALKMETFNELENYPEKVSVIPINNEGGVLVYLRYN